MEEFHTNLLYSLVCGRYRLFNLYLPCLPLCLNSHCASLPDPAAYKARLILPHTLKMAIYTSKDLSVGGIVGWAKLFDVQELHKGAAEESLN